MKEKDKEHMPKMSVEMESEGKNLSGPSRFLKALMILLS